MTMIRKGTVEIGVEKIDGCDVMDAWPAFVLGSGELSLVILLGVARNLRWRLRHHEVSRYVSPVSFPILEKP